MFHKPELGNVFLVKRSVSILAVASLVITGINGLGHSATAGTNIEVFYFGNTIGSSVPASVTVDRDTVPLPPSTSVTGSRAGYSFNGWSLTAGGEPLTGSSYAHNSSTASRLDLFAVWTTLISYNINGATSGSLPVGRSSDVYRFGQVLNLPNAGTLVRTGYSFGGWMAASIDTVRSTTYSASSNAVGNPTLFAAWIKTVGFNANSATNGSLPANLIYTAGGAPLRLPTVSEMTLRKSGFEFVGWSTSASGNAISNPGAYVPLVAQQTLFAVWKVQSTKASSRVFFKPGKATLRATQRLVIRDLIDRLRGKGNIAISVHATYPRGQAKSLARARNKAVISFLRILGIQASYSRSTSLGKARIPESQRNNRVTLNAGWTNPN